MTANRPAASLTRDRDWHRHAACRGADTDLFFGANHGPALEFCNRCPVTQACLAEAMTVESTRYRHGVWGGSGPFQREQLGRGEITHVGGWCAACARQFYGPRLRTRYCSRACAARMEHARAALRAAGVPGEPVLEYPVPIGTQG